MGRLSIWHWLIVALVLVLIFGTGKLKNAGKDLGAALHDFKKSLNGEDKNKSEEKTNPKQEQQKD